MEFSPDKKQSAEPNVPFQKDIVIPDECGDSLWDAVLEQDEAKSLPEKSSGEHKDILNDSNSGKQVNANNKKVMPDAE